MLHPQQEELSKANDQDMYIFVQASFGQGQETDNAHNLFNWVMAPDRESSDQKQRFGHLHFAVFGLGMSQTYPERYQAAAKRLDKRLEQLGARRTLDRGEGDDNGDIEEDFESWMNKLWPKLDEETKRLSALFKGATETNNNSATGPEVQLGGVPTDTQASTPDELAGPHVVTLFLDDNAEEGSTTQPGTTSPLHYIRGGPAVQLNVRKFDPSRAVDVRNPFDARVTFIKELHTPQSGRSCKHIELDISQANGLRYSRPCLCDASICPSVYLSLLLSYQTGDYIGVFPQNHPDVVSAFAQRIGLSLQQTFDVRPSMFFPTPASVGDYLKSHAALTAPLKRSHVAALASLAKNPADKERLDKLANVYCYPNILSQCIYMQLTNQPTTGRLQNVHHAQRRDIA